MEVRGVAPKTPGEGVDCWGLPPPNPREGREVRGFTPNPDKGALPL